jgi:L-ribulokinase
MTLSTTTDDIYRGLVESPAFGARKIVEGFEANGMSVSRIYACGALAFNAPQIMQIYADIIGKPIAIARSRQTAALGAAMSGAVAAGSENGGYDTIFEAIKHMSKPPLVSFSPNRAHREVYQQLYDEYNRLHDCFGCGEGNTMETLKRIRKSAKSRPT